VFERIDPRESLQHCHRFVHLSTVARKLCRVCHGSVPKV
jgi:hypothetical protein